MRQSYFALVACLGLASCGQSPGGPPALSAANALRNLPAHGGAFTATYSGQSTYKRCNGKRMGNFDFSGAGQASFLGASTESGSLVSYVYEPAPYGCGTWQGQVILTSAKHPKSYLAMNVEDGTPCKKPFSFTVAGGFGKFKGATGSGTVKFSCTKSYSDQWSGTISY